ncbi:ring finger protein 1 [Salpingoeca rosetta]|uniref:RING-type E3 ubiquitin transferase n=1 Tax=Salpingoeca rosetta (strain ATCC 50818 / BSB-021) TaxID=946362 RepID=F2U5B6_SALR5|nr:ring finger protein 1 [Salpingoeca rosetta]EGD83132.1 ring finger protein 1 [Salpingoeca rosetta]|eukprot:XP_004995496.1 ring finger protein 1 [Salpingoeca rosetta]
MVMELSEYERQREPHKLQTGEEMIETYWPELVAQMKCPICLNLIEETMATECMHRFCGECIKRSLRHSKKECPTCRKPCASKRVLRRDPNFDELIQTLFPDPDVVEDYQEQLMERLHQTTNMRAVAQSMQEGMQHQALQRKIRTSTINRSIAQRHAAVPTVSASARVPSTSSSSSSTAPSRTPSATTPALRKQQHSGSGSKKKQPARRVSQQHAAAAASSSSASSSSAAAMAAAAAITASSGSSTTSTRMTPFLEVILKPMANTSLPPLDTPYILAPADANGSTLTRLTNHLVSNKMQGDGRATVELLLERHDQIVPVGARLQMRTIAKNHVRWHPAKPLVIYYRKKT